MNSQVMRISPTTYAINLLMIGLVAAGGLWFITQLILDGNYPMGVMVSTILVFLCTVYLRRKFSPMRWLAIGIALAMLFTLYPIFYTVYIAFTNMGDGHLLSKPQVIERLEDVRYLPEGGQSFAWAAYQSADETFALYLIAEDGATFVAEPGVAVTAVSPQSYPLDEDNFPTELDGFQRLTRREIVPLINNLGEIEFGADNQTIRIRSLQEAATLVPKYTYQADQDIILDLETNATYQPINGTFTNDAGETLTPGYIVGVQWRNFVRFLTNDALRGPMVRVLIWSFTFAILSVLLSFIVGLGIALLFEDLKGKRIIRALLIIPYPIPVLISVLIWRSLLNPDLGFLSILLENLFGSGPSWFLDPTWTRVALVLINIWLSYPYFFVITAGALQAIPQEINQAAIVDGASPWQALRHITLPLLLRIVSPLLIASFTFNFNNFNLIYIFNFGDPPMADTIIPVGHTDILISFVYKLAFVTSGTTDYGLAAAISIVLFVFVALITFIQVRYTGAFKEA